MIVGIVRGREPLIRLTIRGFRGRQQEIEAVVDSGYTGWLTLPPMIMVALNLRWQTFGRGILADGSVSTFDVYQAKVVWDGRPRAFSWMSLMRLLWSAWRYCGVTSTKCRCEHGARSRSNACLEGKRQRHVSYNFHGLRYS